MERQQLGTRNQIKMRINVLISLPMLATVASAAQTVYLIRHGEKPADGGDGLTIQGQQRAQCLRTVFGNSSAYNIGKIMAETPKASKCDFSSSASKCTPNLEANPIIPNRRKANTSIIDRTTRCNRLGNYRRYIL
jgi:hypothetical protein